MHYNSANFARPVTRVFEVMHRNIIDGEQHENAALTVPTSSVLHYTYNLQVFVVATSTFQPETNKTIVQS